MIHSVICQVTIIAIVPERIVGLRYHVTPVILMCGDQNSRRTKYQKRFFHRRRAYPFRFNQTHQKGKTNVSQQIHAQRETHVTVRFYFVYLHPLCESRVINRETLSTINELIDGLISTTSSKAPTKYQSVNIFRQPDLSLGGNTTDDTIGAILYVRLY